MVFCNMGTVASGFAKDGVTILILIDGFLQFKTRDYVDLKNKSQSLF